MFLLTVYLKGNMSCPHFKVHVSEADDMTSSGMVFVPIFTQIGRN